jgi:hypothetical protein
MKNADHVHRLERGSRARRDRRENPSYSWGDLSTGYFIAPRFAAKHTARRRQFLEGWVSMGAISMEDDMEDDQ